MPARWITIAFALTFAGLVAACGGEDDDDNGDDDNGNGNGEENGQLHRPMTDVGLA